MASDPDSWLGRTLAGRYTLLGRIGSGGMSTVYEATDDQLGRKVAVKLFPAGEARDDSRRRAEVDVLARLNHPNLVTMYDAHLASGDSAVPSFLVMELVTGPDLRATLDHGPLRGDVAAQIASDIAGGLAAMHAQGIVHRDLKPANILLAPTGLPAPTHRAKLADFGIAHLVGADRMTTVGTVIGTASYLSPEQATGAAPGPAADVYALGLVILEGLTGRREYPGTIVESMSARASRDPVISDAIPAGWVTLLTQMTARSPDARPSALDVAVTAQRLAPELEAWGGFPSGAAADGPTQPHGAPTVALPGAAAAATPSPHDAPTVALPGVAAASRADAPTVALHGVAAAAALSADAPTVAPPGVAAGASQTAATRVDSVRAAAAPPPTEPRRRGRRLALLAVAAAVLVAATWIGGTLLTAAPSADPGLPASTTPAVDTAPATSPGDDDGTTDDDSGTDTGETVTETDPTAPAPAGDPAPGATTTPAPTAPAPTPAAPAPAPSSAAPAPTPSDDPGNNGNGNGNAGSGTGNGNGNNGNGNGNGGPGKG